MTYDALMIIVAVNAVVTLLLWGKVVRKSNGRPRLNKKASTLLWHSDPVIPKHDPPKIAGAEFSSFAGDLDRRFFEDFKKFSDVMNWWLADEYIASRFRLQDLPAGDLSLNVDFSDGPRLGRCFAIYYNQARIGRLEIRPHHKYSTNHPEVYTSFEIDWARFLGFTELTEFFEAVACHVTNSEGNINARLSFQSALTRTLWEFYRVSEFEDANDEEQSWGEVSGGFNGIALFYIDRKDALARNVSAG